MPMPRFRLRALMIAVAVVAIVLGAGLEPERQRRRTYFLRQAASFESAASDMRSQKIQIDQCVDEYAGQDGEAVARLVSTEYRKDAEKYAAEAKRMRDAASRSWPPPVGTVVPE
jgi:hypothetical protein